MTGSIRFYVLQAVYERHNILLIMEAINILKSLHWNIWMESFLFKLQTRIVSGSRADDITIMELLSAKLFTSHATMLKLP